MNSTVDGWNADKPTAMLQLDSSNNLFWRSVVLQDADLDIGMRWCILKALMRATGFSAPLVERLRGQRAVRHRAGPQGPHCGEAHARWSTCFGPADGQSP